MLIFISYAKEDLQIALSIYEMLKMSNFSSWIDVYDLMPGQPWETEIEKAIRNSSIFIACLSNSSVNKRGFFQAELKKAYKVYETIPEGKPFIIPVRLDDCEVPESLRHIQWLDLFKEGGMEKLLRAISHNLSFDTTPGAKVIDDQLLLMKIQKQKDVVADLVSPRWSVFKEANLLRERGDSAFIANDPETAKKCYQDALQIDPEYVDVLNNLSVIYNTDAQVLELEARRKQAKELLAKSKELVAKSKELLDKAIKQDPKHPDVLSNLAAHALYEQNFDEAIRLSQAAIENTSNEKPQIRSALLPYTYLCKIYLEERNDVQQAEMNIKMACKICEECSKSFDPKCSNVHVWLGQVYERKGFLNEAEEAYEIAKKFNPQNMIAIDRLEKLRQGKKASEQFALEVFCGKCQKFLVHSLEGAIESQFLRCSECGNLIHEISPSSLFSSGNFNQFFFAQPLEATLSLLNLSAIKRMNLNTINQLASVDYSTLYGKSGIALNQLLTLCKKYLGG